MIAAVAIENIDVVDFVKMMFERICGKYSRHAGIEAASQKCADSRFFEFFAVCPLPFVFEFCRVFRFIVCRIHIVYLCFQTGIHDFKILVGQSKIQYHVGTEFFDERDKFIDVVRVDLRGPDLCFGRALISSNASLFWQHL